MMASKIKEDALENMLTKRLITPDEASTLLGVRKSWIYRASSDGRFPKGIIIHVGKYLRIDSDLLLAYLRDQSDQ